jgi:hypothetical protein
VTFASGNPVRRVLKTSVAAGSNSSFLHVARILTFIDGSQLQQMLDWIAIVQGSGTPKKCLQPLNDSHRQAPA